MDLSAAVLGKATVAALQTRLATPVLVIGTDRFTRHDLAKTDCFNFIAAATVNTALKDIGATSTRDLFDHYPPWTLALPRIGPIALAVIGCAFLVKKIGGPRPLEAWMAKHSKAGEDSIVTFSTIKKHIHDELRAVKKEARKRKQQRTNKARDIKTERFLARTEAADIPHTT